MLKPVLPGLLLATPLSGIYFLLSFSGGGAVLQHILNLPIKEG